VREWRNDSGTSRVVDVIQTRSRRPKKSIRAALVYIEAHLDQPTTLNTLSEISGLSPNHLHQTFLPMWACRRRGLATLGVSSASRSA
jgi:AraC-like DNA-binding protein